MSTSELLTLNRAPFDGGVAPGNFGSEPGEEGLPWFALRVRSNFERTTQQLLSQKGYQAFLPTYRTKRRWSDRVKEVELPLFPGYLFCRFDPQYRLPILTTPGVVTAIGYGKTPVPVADDEVAAVQAVVNSDFAATPWSFLQVGQRVRIEHGALTGVEGVLESFKGGARLVVSVTLLQRAVAVEIDATCAKPVSSAPAGRREFTAPRVLSVA